MSAAAAFLAAVWNADPSPTADGAYAAGHAAAHFVQQVDRHNEMAAIVGDHLAYADAVLIEGSAGPVVADVLTYGRHRARLEAEAGEVTSVLTGDDLLGRTAKLAAIEAAPDAPESLRERVASAVYRSLRGHLLGDGVAWSALGDEVVWMTAIEHAADGALTAVFEDARR